MVGHDARACPGLQVAATENHPLYHGKLSPAEPAPSNRANRFSDAKLPDIRGVPKGTRDLFTKSCNIVMSIMHYYMLNAALNSTKLENSIIAFLYLPNVIMNSKGKTHIARVTTTILTELLHSSDPISFILIKKDEWEQSSDRSTLLGNKRPKALATDLADPLPRWATSKLELFGKAGTLSKVVQLLESFYKVNQESVIQTHDQNGDLIPDIWGKIKDLHPPSNIDLINSQEDDNIDNVDQLEVDANILNDVITSLPRLSSSGLIGWTNELLSFIYLEKYDGDSSSDSKEFRSLLLKTINLLIKGQGGSNTIWCKSMLIPLGKKNGGIRPLAIDNIFMRIIGKCINALVAKPIGDSLLPIQYAIGISGGCEMVVHTATNWVQHILLDSASNNNNNNIVLKLDLKNAFNSISRNAIRAGVISYAPNLLKYFNWVYGNNTSIYLRDGSEIAKSERGVRQGDPLGPLFFCLGIQVVLTKATELNIPVDAYAIMDDITLHGEAADVLKYLDFLSQELPNIGLSINADKSEIFGNNSNGVITDIFLNYDITILQDGLEILGCPVGTDIYVDDFLKRKYKKFKQTLDTLSHVKTALAFPVLKSCVNTKPVYLTRTCLPWLTQRHNEKFDKDVNALLAHMTQVNTLDSVSVTVRHLPEKNCGLGLPKMTDISSLAWASSYGHALKFTHHDGQDIGWLSTINKGDRVLTRFYEELSKHYPNFSFSDLSFTSKKQSDLKKQQDEEKLSELKELLKNDKERVTWLNASVDQSCPWLSCGIGSYDKFNAPLSDQAMAINMQLRLLIPVVPVPDNFECPCNRQSRTNQKYTRYHALNCQKFCQDITIERHNNVRDIIYNALQHYLPQSRPDRELCHYHEDRPEVHKKPDVSFSTYRNEGKTHIEVAVFNAGCSTYLEKDRNANLRNKEKFKISQHVGHLGEDAKNPDILIPFVVDTVGNIGPSAKYFITKLQGLCKNTSLRHKLHRDISISIARSNAEMFIKYKMAIVETVNH